MGLFEPDSRSDRACGEGEVRDAGGEVINIRTLDQLSFPSGARVFYRVDYNVPLEGATITDATRIEETKATLDILRKRGAAIILASHLGRPKGERKEKYSLKPV